MRVFDQPLAFVDLETTGGSHFNSRVLEVAVVRVEGGRVVKSYSALVYPESSVPPFITALTGISDEDVAGKPRFAEIADEVAELLEGAIFVAHNVRFDYGFLKMEFDRLGARFDPPLLCTVRMSRKLFPQYRTHKLADLIVRHNLVAPARHRALDDAYCLWQFWRLCLSEFDLDTVEQAVRAQLAIPSLPSQLDARQLDALPEGPGVYVFEDDAGGVLYVGKSVTVRRRVMNHFASDTSSGQELKLAQLVRRLRAIPTPGELSALILESDMIKDLQPLYNRLLRRRERVSMIMLSSTPDGYAYPQIVDAQASTIERPDQLLAMYPSAGRAKRALDELVHQFELCPQLMGLERSRRGCFARQLGKCRGACVGREAVAEYNRRFDAAFEHVRVVAWPYRGPVLVTETSQDGTSYAGFVVNQWCLIGQLQANADQPPVYRPELSRFDLDRYRILRRYLQTANPGVTVQPLNAAALAELEALDG